MKRVFFLKPGVLNLSKRILKEALPLINGPDYSGILHIVRTPHIAEERLRAFHKEVGYKAYLPPNIITLRQFALDLFSKYGKKMTVPSEIIPVVLSSISNDGIGFSKVMADFITETKEYLSFKDIEELEGRLKSIFNELDIPESVLKRVEKTISVFKDYERLKKDSSIVDEEDTMLFCPEIIKEKISPSILIIDSIFEATLAEKEILRCLIEKSGHTIVYIPIGNSKTPEDFIIFLRGLRVEEHYIEPDIQCPKNICHPFPSKEDEIEGIARHIKHFFISGVIRDLSRVVVSFPNVEPYREITQRVFRRYGIPISMKKKPLLYKRPYRDAILMLEAISEDYPRLSFSSFLLSPYFTKIPDKLRINLPRASLSSAIIKGKNRWLSILKKNKEDLEWVFEKLSPIEKIKDSASYSDYLKGFYKVLDSLGFMIDLRGDDSLSDAKKPFRWLSFIEIIEGLNKKTTLRGFIDALRHILQMQSPQERTDGVRVVALKDALGLESEFLYIGGLSDSALPSLPSIDYLLPETIRKKLGLKDLKSHIEKDEFLFESLRLSAKNTYLTFPNMDGDSVCLPSTFISKYEVVKDSVSGIFSPEEMLIKEGMKNSRPLTNYIKEINKIRKFSKSKKLNVTNIDDYRFCPRKFFIEKVLALEPPQLEEDIEASTIGSVIHEVMEKLYPLKCSDIESLKEEVLSIFNAIPEEKIEGFWKKFLQDVFLDMIPKICKTEDEIKNSGYEFYSVEKRIETTLLDDITLKGKIDRIDKNPDGKLWLIDYKTGGDKLSRSDILKGKSLQLLLYSAMLKQLGMMPEKVSIYSLRELKLFTPIPKGNETLDQYIEIALEFLKDTITKLRNGEFASEPIDEHICKSCAEAPYCPHILLVEAKDNA